MSKELNGQKPLRPKRYRKQLFSAQQLKDSAAQWATQLNPLYKAWKANKISPAEAACVYLILGLEARLPGRWLGGRSPSRLTPIPSGPPIGEWLCLSPSLARHLSQNMPLSQVIHGFSLKGVRLVARETLLRWLAGEWPLLLTDQIPTPVELLKEQIWGRRLVTAAFQESELANYLHDDRDALSFLLHDLGHAEQFFRNKIHRDGQIGSYRLLQQAQFADNLYAPSQFSGKWDQQLDYLIADLNTHPLHFWSVFWASARECFGPNHQPDFAIWRDQLFSLWDLPPRIQLIMQRPSRNASPEEAELLLHFLLQKSSQNLH